mmetsp:Transcript_22376/g.39004  ORF Transcript_22376/g.39004 Transcript_22376/m.39004 type:complete len:404 (+) Transcript_22376:80-1291(+)
MEPRHFMAEESFVFNEVGADEPDNLEKVQQTGNPFTDFIRRASSSITSLRAHASADQQQEQGCVHGAGLIIESTEQKQDDCSKVHRPPSRRPSFMVQQDLLLSPRRPDRDDITTLIHKAIQHREIKELRQLLSDKRTRRLLVDTASKDGQTPLHYAAWSDQPQAVKLLLRAGANLEARDSADGTTPLMKACFNGNIQVVHLLTRAGADMNNTSDDLKTALHMAAWEGHLEVVRYLADHGAEVHVEDDGGCAPLHYCIMSGHLEVVEYMLFKRANIAAPDNDGWSPLHYATYFGMTEIVTCLLEHGATIHAENKDRERPGWSFYETVDEQTRLTIARCLGAASVSKSVEEQECTICMNAPKESLMAPCGHVSSCHSCAMKIYNMKDRCPVCRQRIDKVYKVYYT